uniref:Protein phosphatase 2 regulatory subunit B''gamma n=1 Tax=Sus scrofa TaxID=9823 RepID=A0A8D1KTX5_PIG
MDWKEILRRRLAMPNTGPNKKKTEQELKDEEMDLFTKYYSEWKGDRKNTNEFYKTIPRFYYRLPAEDEVLLQKLREESRAVFLQRKSRELLDNEELQVRMDKRLLWKLPIFYLYCVCHRASQGA